MKAEVVLQREKDKEESLKPGTSIIKFLHAYGEPTTKEVVNGDTVYWYDDQYKPMFYIFKNNKLNSVIVDRKTISEGAASRQAYQIQNNIMEQNRRISEENARRQQQMIYMNYMQNSIKQPTQTNCQKDHFTGGITCQSY